MEILFILEKSWFNYIGDQRKSLKNETPYRRRFLKVFTINEHGGHLGHATLPFILTFFTTSQGGSTRNLALTGQAISEKMFENNGHIHVFSPGAGADHLLGSNIFH